MENTETITERLSAAIKFYALTQVAMGSTVLLAATQGGDPMPLTTHGSATMVFSTQEWAYAVILQGLILWVAAHARWSFGMIVSGAWGAIINAALAYYSSSAPFGFIVTVGAIAFSLAHWLIAMCAVFDFVRASKNRFEHWRSE